MPQTRARFIGGELMPRVQKSTKTETQNTIQADDVHTLTQLLYERGISPQVIDTFQIVPSGQGWEFPTPSGAVFWKNANSDAPNGKYVWKQGSDAKGLYYASNIADAIMSADGVCWYVSGSPDNWAMHSAGIPHTINGFSESVIPSNLIQTLYSWGVEVLYIAPDLDQQGARWADNLATVLYDSGIDLIARTLPDELGESGDIGKLWKQYRKRQPFERYLLSLPNHDPQIILPTIQQATTYTSRAGDIAPHDKSRICDLLGVQGWKGNGWSKNLVHCPEGSHHQHNDADASLSVHRDKGAKCRVSGKFYLWRDLAELLGLGSLEKVTTDYTQDVTETIAPIGFVGLSVELQQEFITMGFTSLARLLDVLYSQGYQGGEEVTVKQTSEICGGIVKPYTIRKAFEQAEGKEHAKKGNKTKRNKGRGLLLRVFVPSLLSSTDVTKSLINSPPRKHRATNTPKGRKSKVIRIPSRDELTNALDIEAKTYQPMTAKKLANSADYKAEIMAVKVRLKAGQYARKQLAKPLGIHPNTTRAYARRARINSRPVIKRETVTAERLETLKLQLAKRLPKNPKRYRFFEVTDGGQRYQYTQAGMYEALKHARDGVIVECTQEANYYEDARP